MELVHWEEFVGGGQGREAQQCPHHQKQPGYRGPQAEGREMEDTAPGTPNYLVGAGWAPSPPARTPGCQNRRAWGNTHLYLSAGGAGIGTAGLPPALPPQLCHSVYLLKATNC